MPDLHVLVIAADGFTPEALDQAIRAWLHISEHTHGPIALALPDGATIDDVVRDATSREFLLWLGAIVCRSAARDRLVSQSRELLAACARRQLTH